MFGVYMPVISGNKGLYILSGETSGIDGSVIAEPYSVDTAYSKGDLMMNNGYLYSALVDMEPGEWDETKWLKTNVAASIPTKTSQLENDSGFINNELAGEWEDISSDFSTPYTFNIKRIFLNRVINTISMYIKIGGVPPVSIGSFGSDVLCNNFLTFDRSKYKFIAASCIGNAYASNDGLGDPSGLFNMYIGSSSGDFNGQVNNITNATKTFRGFSFSQKFELSKSVV